MFHAQAFVPTQHPSQMGARVAAELGLEFTTEWAAEAGCVELPDGICDMHAWPEGLRLDAFAPTRAGLDRVADVVKRRLEHLSASDRLDVAWYHRPSAS